METSVRFPPYRPEEVTVCDSISNDTPVARESGNVPNEVASEIDACLLARSNQGDRARLLTENKAGSIPAVPANPLTRNRARGRMAMRRAANSVKTVRFRPCSPSGGSSMVERRVANATTGVRFSFTAPTLRAWSMGRASPFQGDEAGSSPAARSRPVRLMVRPPSFHVGNVGFDSHTGHQGVPKC